MKCVYIVVAACYIIHQSYSDHIIIGENGDYKGIWVGFSRRIETDDKQQLLENLKLLLIEASKVLHELTDQRTYFKEITFIIPQSWGEEENWISADGHNVSKIGLERYNEADIFVEAENGFFGQIPYTIQAAGCEEQGLGIHIPETFLQLQGASAREKAQTLVSQWLKYRYGVFDEHGFYGDDRYPVLHGIPGNSEYMKVTSCSNHDVKYNYLDESDARCVINRGTGRLNDSSCPIIIEERSSDQSSSFMFSPKMSKLCGNGDQYPHDVSSPTKHNVLCFERSIANILFRHKDLKVNHGTLLENTTFRYVQESELRLLIAVDRTVDTSDFKLHNLLPKVITMSLGLSLSRDHLVNLLFYDSRNLTVRRRFEERWSYPGTDDTGSGCIHCALRDSLQILEEYEPMDGSIFVLLARRTLYNNEIDTLYDMATVKKIRIHVVFCFTDEASASQFAEKVVGTGIKIQNIPMEKDSFVYLLYNALQGSFRDDTFGMVDDNIVIMQKYFSNLAKYVNFTFPVDMTAKRDVRILLSTPDLRDIYDDQSSVSLTTDLKKMELDIKFTEDLQSGLKTLEFLKEPVGDIAVSIYKKAGVPVEVLVLAKESNDVPGVIVRSWLNHADQFIMVDSDSSPVILYTEVRSGNFPVRNANVKANLYHQNTKITTFSLIDDGNGDPDITKDDGIYSSYITQFRAGGDYFLQIFVDDDGSAETVSKTKKDNTCCGSSVPVEKTMPTGNFLRLYTYGSFYVSIPQDQGNDFYPPSRITDLMVTDTYNRTSDDLSHDIIYVKFSFSAPGGDYNHGEASRYELSYSNYRSKVKSFENETIPDVGLVTMPSSKKYGEKATFQFEIPGDKLKEFQSKNFTVIYFAVRAIDKKNKVGKTSNIVEVQLPPPPPPPVNPSVSSTSKPDQDGNGNGSTGEQYDDDPRKTNSAQVGIIIGIVIGIISLIIIAVLVTLFVLSRRKRTRRLEDNSGSLANNEISKEYLSGSASNVPTTLSNPISPIQSWPADVLLDHYNKVQEAKNKNRSSGNSTDSSSSDCSRPLKPNPIYEKFNKDSYSVDNSCLPSAPYSSSQSSLNQTPRSVTQV